jgi:hypothetical protein
MTEIYKQIPDFNNYMISNYANIICKTSKKPIKRHINTQGYQYIVIKNNNGFPKVQRIHELIADLFVPNPNEYTTITHVDENKLNNEVTNIVWSPDPNNLEAWVKRYKLSEGKHCNIFYSEISLMSSH